MPGWHPALTQPDSDAEYVRGKMAWRYPSSGWRQDNRENRL